MALIKCPECGKEVSDQSEQCVHCGFPLQKIQNQAKTAGLVHVNIDKHPNESKIIGYSLGCPQYGKTERLYIMADDDCIAEGQTGFQVDFKISKPTTVFASWSNKTAAVTDDLCRFVYEECVRCISGVISIPAVRRSASRLALRYYRFRK